MEHIQPALTLIDGQSLSADEFQRMLFAYFEEHGILADLRAHLRAQMIGALRQTSLGKTVVARQPAVSPRIQALNLLVAEYLLVRNCHCTLSVFSAEVPLPASLMADVDRRPFRFVDSDAWDILEALGLSRERIATRYKMENECLLGCIVQDAGASTVDVERCEMVRHWLAERDLHAMDLEVFVTMFREMGLDVELMLQLVEQLKVVVTNECRNLRILKDSEVRQMRAALARESAGKVEKYKTRYANLEGYYVAEKQRLEAELEHTRENLADATKDVQEKYQSISELNRHIAELKRRLGQQEQTLLNKEQCLQQRQSDLELKQEAINQHFQELISARKVQHSETETDGGWDGSRRLVEQLRGENEGLHKAVGGMQTEMALLKEQNHAYQTKIQELLMRTGTLMAQLETSHTGGGGQRMRHFYPGRDEGRPPAITSHHEFFTVHNRKHMAISSSSSDESEGPTTEEVLQEAKARLLELERESDVIDLHYDRLAARPPSSGSATNNILSSFQSNITLLRESITKIFTGSSSTGVVAPPPPPCTPVKTMPLADERPKRRNADKEQHMLDAQMGCIVEEEEDGASIGGNQAKKSTSSDELILDVSVLDESGEFNGDLAAVLSSPCDWLDIGERWD